MSKIEVDTIEPQSGTTVTLGASGDTISVTSGATLGGAGTVDLSSATLTLAAEQIATSKLGNGAIIQNVSSLGASYSKGHVNEYLGDGVTITPTTSSNKILILISFEVEGNASGGEYAGIKLHRNTTQIAEIASAVAYLDTGGHRQFLACTHLDSPATTSATQYRVYHNSVSATQTYQYRNLNLIAMEVVA